MSADFPPLPPLPPSIHVALPAPKYDASPALSAQRTRRESQAMQDVQPPPLPPALRTDNGTQRTRDLSFSEWMQGSAPRAELDRDAWAELGDATSYRTRVAADLQRAIDAAHRIAAGPSPLSWTAAFLSTFTQKGKRELASTLSVRFARLEGLAGELRHSLQRSDPSRRGALQRDTENPQSDEEAPQGDWPVSQIDRLRDEAERFLRAIDAELLSLESELSALSERLR